MPNSQNVPDVRVRLSASGVDEVVQAFLKVQQAAEKSAGHGKSGGVSLLSGVMADLQSALPTLSIAAAVAGFIALEKAAFNNANAISNLAVKTNTSTEMLSVFAFAATAANVSTEDMGQGLVKLARSMDQASEGITQPLDSFRRLGISMKQIKSSDPGQMFKLVADRLANVKDGSEKAAIAQNLLGKSGANLLPLLNDIANQGYQKVADKAMRMGMVLDGQTRDAINRADNALADMQNLLIGIATQLLAGFAPGVSDAIEMMIDQIDQGGVKGLQKVGAIFGRVVKGIAGLFIAIGQIVGAEAATTIELWTHAFDIIKLGATGVYDVIKKLAHGDFSGAKASAKRTASDIAGNVADFVSREKGIGTDLVGKLTSTYQAATSPISDPGKHDEKDRIAREKARQEMLKAAVDNELALFNTRNTLESQQNDRDFADGLESLQAYYDKRRDLIKQAGDAEIAALQKKIALTKNDPQVAPGDDLKKKKEIAALQNQIDQKRLQVAGQLKALDDEQNKADIQRNIQKLDLDQKIADLEGKRSQSMAIALDSEIAKMKQEMALQGRSAEEIAQAAAAIRAVQEARNAFTLASQRGSQALDDLKLATADIQRLQSTGAINELQANAQIIQLERNRLDDLREIGRQLTLNAQKSNDPQLVEQAKQYNAQIADLAASLDTVGKAMGELKTGALNSAKQAFDTFFTDVLSGSKSAADAWKALADTFRQIVAQMVAKLIELYFWMLLLKLVPSLSKTAGTATGSGLTNVASGFPFSGSEGGFTGMGARDAIAGVVHGQEYVLNADATKAIGVDLLDALNAGAFRPVPVRSLSSFSMPSASAMQPLAAGSGTAGGAGTVVNIDTQGQPAQASKSTVNGRDIIDVVIGHVAADIRKGGKAGQAVQQTFALRRQGVTRG